MDHGGQSSFSASLSDPMPFLSFSAFLRFFLILLPLILLRHLFSDTPFPLRYSMFVPQHWLQGVLVENWTASGKSSGAISTC